MRAWSASNTVVPGMSWYGFESDIRPPAGPSRDCVGLSTSSFRCSTGVGAMAGIRSTSAPSSGMCERRFGCGQSVPQSTRSGNSSTRRRANGTKSVYSGGPVTESRSGHVTLLPDPWARAHQPDKAFELGAVDRFRDVRAAHVVDDDRCRQRSAESSRDPADRAPRNRPPRASRAPRSASELARTSRRRQPVDQPLDEVES